MPRQTKRKKRQLHRTGNVRRAINKVRYKSNRGGFIAGMNVKRREMRGDYNRGYRHGKFDQRTKK